jgi:hypothetical protein
MNFQFYLEKLEESEAFKGFMKQYPDAYLCSGFFVIETGKGQQHLDFFIPSEKKLFSFQLEEEIKLVPIDFFGAVPEKLKEHDFDFSEIEKMIFEEVEKQKVDKKIQKILFSIQPKEGKCFAIANVFTSNFGILKVTIDTKDNKVVEFEQKSFFNMFDVFKKK